MMMMTHPPLDAMYAVGCTQAARDKEGGGDIDPETKRDFPGKKEEISFFPRKENF